LWPKLASGARDPLRLVGRNINAQSGRSVDIGLRLRRAAEAERGSTLKMRTPRPRSDAGTPGFERIVDFFMVLE
jgi:hypothetical protein